MMRRRKPGCGSDLEHGPHAFTEDRKWDGTVIGRRDDPAWCAGWTAAEAGLCVMLRAVQIAMAKNGGTGRPFRLEVSASVAVPLQGLFASEDPAELLEKVHGAEVVVCRLPAGTWRLSEVRPPAAEGTVPV